MFLLKKHQYRFNEERYDFITAIEITDSEAVLVRRHFDNLKSEAPMFYKWELCDTINNTTISRRITASDLLAMLKESETKKPVVKEPQEYNKVIKLIEASVKRTVDKLGVQDRPPLEWMAILGEEVGEANECVVEKYINKTSKYTMDDYKSELVDVATVAINALTSLLRNELKQQ